jgi:CubicO group peptidase (beta-lactamase class C family)
LALAFATCNILTAAPTPHPPPYATPEFKLADRPLAIDARRNEIETLLRTFAEQHHIPGLSFGILLDGALVHTGTLGFADIERRLPVTRDTRFRIASMTKSFLALATLQLRDAGRLQLDDPAAHYVPEMRRLRGPTPDSPAITIRHLMTMTSGLPEDNPWGDQQLAINLRELRQLVEAGLAFSNPPGQEFEYSNLGYVLLGRVVSRAARMPFQRYVTKHILHPLGMHDTLWEYTNVPPSKLAAGYRWENASWRSEPILHDGLGGAMGGLITTMDDFSRYAAFHLDAWPARQTPDLGPARRATLREMHQPSAFMALNTQRLLPITNTPNPTAVAYGYGLVWSLDSRGLRRVGHSGGLPGYGSHVALCPDLALAVIVFANRTYAPAAEAATKVIDLLTQPGALEPRVRTTSAILETRQRQVAYLVRTWDETLGRDIAAENFFRDRSRELWMRHARETFDKLGPITTIDPLQPQNQLRGTFAIHGERGKVLVRFTLTPERPPKLQELSLEFVPNP